MLAVIQVRLRLHQTAKFRFQAVDLCNLLLKEVCQAAVEFRVTLLHAGSQAAHDGHHIEGRV